MDSGYIGVLRSLSNYPGIDGRGREFAVRSVNASSAAGLLLLGVNPGRIAAYIENFGTETVYLHFEDPLATAWITLLPLDAFIINKDFPWSGNVFVTGSSATSSRVNAIELGLP